ncbi:MAG: replicative DNA helicase [Clostridia bacterium]|nr:replicative DNA helicase [Clostridia bacterium]
MQQVTSDLSYYGFNLPYSQEAEQALIGAVLFKPDCFEKIIELVPQSDYFYVGINKKIYSTMIKMFSLGITVDAVTVVAQLEKDKEFEANDGKSYILDVLNSVPAISNVEAYADIVKEKYDLRRLIIAAKDILDEVSNSADSAEMLLNSAEQKIFNIRQGKDVDGLVHINEALVETFDRLDELNAPGSDVYSGISTGIKALDSTIMGLNKSDLILLAARPGMGKTSFALNIATHAAVKSKKKTAFFSLEMTKEQLASRMLSALAQVSGTKLRTGKLSSDEWVRIVEAGDMLSKSNMFLDDTSSITVPQMKAKLRRLRNVDLVIIDYLQLMSGSVRTNNRVQEVSEITRSLKIMAKELNVPVIVLSQLSRASEQRTQHRPLLSDLRDSGSIEQDADIVLFLYRPDYYSDSEDNKSEEELANNDKNAGECIVAKNRHGEVKTVHLHWQGEFMRFTASEVHTDE